MVETIDKGLDYNFPYSPLCNRCTQLLDAENRTCNAFPKGIPDVVWKGEWSHNEPFPGQGNEVVFEESQ